MITLYSTPGIGIPANGVVLGVGGLVGGVLLVVVVVVVSGRSRAAKESETQNAAFRNL